jgi:hypothetical protein
VTEAEASGILGLLFFAVAAERKVQEPAKAVAVVAPMSLEEKLAYVRAMKPADYPL